MTRGPKPVGRMRSSFIAALQFVKDYPASRGEVQKLQHWPPLTRAKAKPKGRT